MKNIWITAKPRFNWWQSRTGEKKNPFDASTPSKLHDIISDNLESEIHFYPGTYTTRGKMSLTRGTKLIGAT